MTDFDATESAYKNGYNDGYAKGQLDALESTKINIRKILIESNPDVVFIFGSCGNKDFACRVPFDYKDFCKFYCGKEERRMSLYEDMLKVAAERGLEALNEEIQREKTEEGSEKTGE